MDHAPGSWNSVRRKSSVASQGGDWKQSPPFFVVHQTCAATAVVAHIQVHNWLESLVLDHDEALREPHAFPVHESDLTASDVGPQLPGDVFHVAGRRVREAQEPRPGRDFEFDRPFHATAQNHASDGGAPWTMDASRQVRQLNAVMTSCASDGDDANPYVRRLKRSVTIRLDGSTIALFKNLAADTGISYQTLINSYLRDCAETGRRPSMRWVGAAKGPA